MSTNLSRIKEWFQYFRVSCDVCDVAENIGMYETALRFRWVYLHFKGSFTPYMQEKTDGKTAQISLAETSVSNQFTSVFMHMDISFYAR